MNEKVVFLSGRFLVGSCELVVTWEEVRTETLNRETDRDISNRNIRSGASHLFQEQRVFREYGDEIDSLPFSENTGCRS